MTIGRRLGPHYSKWVDAHRSGTFRMFDWDLFEFFASTRWQVRIPRLSRILVAFIYLIEMQT